MAGRGWSYHDLLNPQAAAKNAQLKNRAVPPANPYSAAIPFANGNNTSPASKSGPVNTGNHGSMIERMHKIEERRALPPNKRRKIDEESDQQDQHKKFQNGFGGGGDIAREVKEGREQGAREAHAAMMNREVIDITGEDDVDATQEDDEVQVIEEAIVTDIEVCIGKIQDAKIMAHKVPSPKMAPMGNQSSWPAMKVTLTRRPGSSNQVITVSDPMGKDFGNVDPRTARALAPLMDAVKTSKIRWVSRLNMRNKKPFEFPGQAISTNYDVTIVLYCPRRLAKGIGKIFSQQGIFLRDPAGILERGIDFFNPQAPTDFTPKNIRQQVATTSRYTSTGSSVIRTAEQVRNDVVGIMDSLTKSSNLPESEAPPEVATSLLSHQKQALKFMTDREKDRRDDDTKEDESSLWKKQIKPNGRQTWYNVITGHETNKEPDPILGGILADVMGLGKTLSVLSTIMATRAESEKFGEQVPSKPDFHDEVGESDLKFNSRATLLICPLSTVANWESQIQQHLKSDSLKSTIYHGSKRTNDPEELTDNDIVITTYSVVAADYDKRSRFRPNDPLAEINWFRIVLDEAHLIREASTKQSKAVCNLKAERRWAVTGTPVQNRLSDLGALFKFLRIRPFDEARNFAQYIEAPFKSADPEILSHLRILVDSITLRRQKDKIDLPPRSEEIVRLEFTSDEKQLYDQFKKESQSNEARALFEQDKLSGRAYGSILKAIMRLRRLCAHGQDLLDEDDYNAAKGYSTSNPIDLEDEKKPSDISPRQAYDMYRLMRDSSLHQCSKCSKTIEPPETSEYEPEDEDEDNEPFGYLTPCNHLICPTCKRDFRKEFVSRAGPDGFGFCSICEGYNQMALFTFRPSSFRSDEETMQAIASNPKLAKHNGRYSGPHTKVKALLEYMDADVGWSEQHPDEPRIKSVIFSSWTSNLDLIQIALVDKGVKFTRLDGSMSRSTRKAALQEFADDPEVECILVSLGAGGLGLNLTAANRVYMMEPQFNPAAEAQAIERVHRLGQTRAVRISKFIMNGSIEPAVLNLQARKKRLASMSMDKQKSGESKDAVSERMKDLRSLFK